MARLGKRERAQKRELYTFIREHVNGIVTANLAMPKPQPSPFNMRATRTGFVAKIADETATLKGNTHTQGISIGQREYRILKPGSMELASNKRRYR